MTKVRYIILIILFSLILMLPLTFLTWAEEAKKTVIYYNQACTGCLDYIEKDLILTLKENGIGEITKKDYLAEKNARQELLELNEKWGIPIELESHIMTFVGKEIVLAGHVPKSIISDFFKLKENLPEKIIVWQDIMHGQVKSYKIWAFAGPIKKYSIETSIQEYLNWFKENQSQFVPSQETFLGFQFKNLLPLVLISGFLDGIHPCGFAVLLFFIAFLLMLRRSLKNIFFLGSVYIIVIYLTYLGIGLGILKAIVISGQPHLLAKIGAWLLIFLGLVNLKDYFFPHLPFKLKIPKFSQPVIKHWLEKATLPAVIVGAFLVGLCAYPCVGGIYTAVILLLASKTTFLKGFLYLLLYNLMFVLPLLIVLLLVANTRVLAKLAEYQKKSERLFKLFMGLAMIGLGIVILVFFV